MINFALHMRNLPVIAIVSLLLAGCVSKPSEGESAKMSNSDSKGVREEKPRPPKPPKYDLRVLEMPYEEVFNDSNYIQYMSAERLGIDPLTSLGHAYNTRRPLVKIESGENYEVAELTHSMPYLVPEAAELLDEIGSEFNRLVAKKGGKSGNKIIVTSVLRSPYTVKKLMKVNRNAVDSSTHKFATTFDIAYNNFACPDSGGSLPASKLKDILAEVLLNKRNEGKCFIKYEIKSPCFHITVNKD